MQFRVKGDHGEKRDTNHPDGGPHRDGRDLGPTQYSYEPRAGSVNLIKKPSSRNKIILSGCDRFRISRRRQTKAHASVWRRVSISANPTNAIGRALHDAACSPMARRTVGAWRTITARPVVGQTYAPWPAMHARPAALGDEGDLRRVSAAITWDGHGLRSARKPRQPEGHGEAQTNQTSLHRSSSCRNCRGNGLAPAGFPERRGRRAR